MTRYALRMLIENGISEAIQFFHLDALSSMVGLKVDFDLQLTLMASSLYRLLADKIGREYGKAQVKTIFRNLLDRLPATVEVGGGGAGERDIGQTRPQPLPGRFTADRSANTHAVVWWQTVAPPIRLIKRSSCYSMLGQDGTVEIEARHCHALPRLRVRAAGLPIFVPGNAQQNACECGSVWVDSTNCN